MVISGEENASSMLGQLGRPQSTGHVRILARLLCLVNTSGESRMLIARFRQSKTSGRIIAAVFISPSRG